MKKTSLLVRQSVYWININTVIELNSKEPINVPQNSTDMAKSKVIPHII